MIDDLAPELVRALDELAPADPTARERWGNVLARLEQRERAETAQHRWPPRRRLVLAAALVAIVLTAVAAATYFALRDEGGTPIDLTLIGDGDHSTVAGESSAIIVSIALPHGGPRTLWTCPQRDFCGSLTSVAWTPDGRRLAFTLDQMGGTSTFVGLHLIDLATGRDIRVPAVPAGPAGLRMLRRMAAVRTFGCVNPIQLAWSPDGARLAYTCESTRTIWRRSAVYTIRPDGTDRRRLPTRVPNAAWAAWSPDGAHIAFATAPRRDTPIWTDTRQPRIHVHSSIVVMRLDGSDRRVVAPDGTAPTWSPDGRRIAYAGRCGIEVVHLRDQPATVSCVAPGLRDGVPAWAPDGEHIAVAAADGTWLVGLDGRRPSRLTDLRNTTYWGLARPTWRPPTAPGPDDRREPAPCTDPATCR